MQETEQVTEIGAARPVAADEASDDAARVAVAPGAMIGFPALAPSGSRPVEAGESGWDLIVNLATPAEVRAALVPALTLAGVAKGVPGLDGRR